MSETITYVTLLHHLPVGMADEKLRQLVRADIDCYMDEKRDIVVHPDQYEKAQLVVMKNI